MEKKIRPMQDFILVEPYEVEEEEASQGGIILLSGSKEKTEATRLVRVKEVGPGKMTPIKSVKAGDILMVPHYAGIDVKVSSDEEYSLIRVTDVLAIIEEED